jgi:hypothetical protein
MLCCSALCMSYVNCTDCHTIHNPCPQGHSGVLVMVLVTRCVPCVLQGERTLSFVLGNRGLIDKTLLFDIDLIRVQK